MPVYIYGLVDPRTDEIRAARSRRMKGNRYSVGNKNAAGKRSPEFRKRMAEVARQTKNALGHEVSEEARQQISESLKAYYRKKRLAKTFTGG